ncbi:MAG: TetR/AcrR family transcriptional regulator [Actinobacteria bacterium]|nr:TetR/AcrR family transcriptional regulator [Actinomycetota bacterium]
MTTAPPDPAPRRAEDPLRGKLLDAAARVFARQGYDGTKILDIVREAGLSTGAVYGRFRSKNDLLREAIMVRSGSAARLGDDGVDRVADLVTRGASRIAEPLADHEAVRLEAYVTARREPEVARALSESVARWHDAAQPLVEAARGDGTIREDVDAEAVLFFVRALHLGLLLHRGSGLPGPDQDAWSALVAGVVASFGAPQPAPTAPGSEETP